MNRTIRNSIIVVASLLLAALVVTACSTGLSTAFEPAAFDSDDNTAISLKPANAEQDMIKTSLASGTDYTVTVPSYDIDPADVQPVVQVFVEYCYSKLSQTTKELDEDSQWIVKGTVVNVEFTHSGPFPFIKMDFRIDESIKGGLEPGDTISVFRNGGFISIADVVAARNSAVRYEAIPEDQWATTFQEEYPSGTGYPEVGDSFVFFLSTEEMFPGAYFPAGLDQCIFKADDQGFFTRVNPISEYLDTDGTPVINSFTIDELYQYFGG